MGIFIPAYLKKRILTIYL